jgi:hypothetical protein
MEQIDVQSVPAAPMSFNFSIGSEDTFELAGTCLLIISIVSLCVDFSVTSRFREGILPRSLISTTLIVALLLPYITLVTLGIPNMESVLVIIGRVISLAYVIDLHRRYILAQKFMMKDEAIMRYCHFVLLGFAVAQALRVDYVQDLLGIPDMWRSTALWSSCLLTAACCFLWFYTVCVYIVRFILSSRAAPFVVMIQRFGTLGQIVLGVGALFWTYVFVLWPHERSHAGDGEADGVMGDWGLILNAFTPVVLLALICSTSFYKLAEDIGRLHVSALQT